MSHALPEPFLTALRQDFPDDFLSLDPDDLAEFGRDWTRVYDPAPAAVTFPRTTDEVSRLLKLCQEHGVFVVPSGGRTGLAGGAVAARGELVVSLTRMRRMDPVDTIGGTVRVQAGAITEAVHQHCEEHGLTWPVDFASKGSSQVGGNIATNAGGVRVIRYGTTRQWVLGLEVVLASGDVLDLTGALEKNNTGLDLRQLFIGSEGTLGIITEATLKLVPVPRAAQVFLFVVDDLAGVVRLFRKARSAPFTLQAFEFFTDHCVERVLRHRNLRLPFEGPGPCYALLEVEASGTEPGPELEAWLEGLFEAELVRDGVLAQSSSQAAELWALRESISESLSATGLPHKNDVSLPVARLERFCEELERHFMQHFPNWEVCLFGHIGDGNLHINVMKPDSMTKEAFLARAKDVDRHTFDLVRRHHGSISAEHGIGLLKKPFLEYSRSPLELELFRRVKRALDPNGILNPGKVFD